MELWCIGVMERWSSGVTQHSNTPTFQYSAGKTTSIGLGGSFAFLSVWLVFVPLMGATSAAMAEPAVFSASVTVFVFPLPAGSFGNRVVTLGIGTERMLVR